MVCSYCQIKPAEGYLKWYCSDCSKLKRLINLHGSRVYEILDNVLLRSEDKQKNKELLEIKKEVQDQEKKLNDSVELYDTKDKKELMKELKDKLKKK